MYSESFIQQLKKTNISADEKKTCQRVKTLWQGASKEQRDEILALSGLGRATIQRVYTTGIISAKLVAAMTQVLEVNPYYIIGRSENQSQNEEESLDNLFVELKYGKLMAQYQNRAARRRVPRKSTQEAVPIVAEASETPDPQQQALMDSLSEEDIVLLLRSILLKAKAGGHYARIADQIRMLLIS